MDVKKVLSDKIQSTVEMDNKKRQWQTVNSDSEEDDRDSRSESSSSDDKEEDHHHHHKDKKHKKDKDKKKDKKHKHDKKHKKDKKEKKEKSHKSSSVSVNQNEYGKYGIIKEEHLFQKQREFEAYMAEVKGVAGVMNESKRDIMQHFKSFIEDYNTATMPHKKYYNYEMWEMVEYQRRKQESSSSSKHDADDHLQGRFMNDEEAHRLDRKRLKDEEERKAFNKVKDRLAQDKEALESMKRQSDIKLEMQLAFKRGDTEHLKKLERSLIPDKEETVRAGFMS